MKTYEHFRSVFAFISILYSLVTLSQTRLCPNVNIEDNQLNNPIVWRNQPQIHVVNWINDNLCNNVQECYGNDNNNLEKSEHFPQLCPLYVQFGDPIYFVSGPGEKDFLNPIAVSQRDFYNCSLITYPYYWKVTTFPKRHSLKVPLKFLFPSDHHFMQIPFLGSPGCETGFRLKVTVRTQDCTVSSYPNKPCFDNGYCVFINDKGGDKLNNGNETGQNCSLKNPNDLVNQEGLQIFTCKCRVPYKGRYCEDYDACWNHACQNGGLCNDLRKGINNREYTCTCQINYIGKHCEYVKSCFEGLCQNGGQCFYDTTRPAHFQCICLPGFSGNRCEITTGPERQYLDNITGNLIREQEARDKALQEGGQDMIQTLDNMGVNSSRLSYPRILIAPFIYRNMTAPSTCNPAQTGADCFECGCPHSGVCIRESPQGPNTCFCPPGVSGPSCKTLAGVCTYAQPCSNGGTCLERMAGGKANDKESDQEDEDALVFPAPGENAPPQPTISWSLLTATPMPQSLVTTGNSNLGDSSSTTKQAYICLCSKGYYGYNCDTKSKDGRVCTTSDCCKDGEGEIVGPGMDKSSNIDSSKKSHYGHTVKPNYSYTEAFRTSYTKDYTPTSISPDTQKIIDDLKLSCHNGATPYIHSSNDLRTFMCYCPQNFVGKFCETSLIPDTDPNTVPYINFATTSNLLQPNEIESLKLSCQNGATPYIHPSGDLRTFVCYCPSKFIGKYCETSLTAETEVIFNADSASTYQPIFPVVGYTQQPDDYWLRESYSPAPQTSSSFPPYGVIRDDIITPKPPYIANNLPPQQYNPYQVPFNKSYHIDYTSDPYQYNQNVQYKSQLDPGYISEALTPTFIYPSYPQNYQTEYATPNPMSHYPIFIAKHYNKFPKLPYMNCENGGTPYHTGPLDNFYCICPSNFFGKFCESVTPPISHTPIITIYDPVREDYSPLPYNEPDLYGATSYPFKPFIGQVVCHNGGTIVNENTCRCPRGFSGNQCEISQPVEAVLPGGIIQTGQQYTTTNVPAPSTSLIAKEGVCVDNYECQNGGECLKKMLPDGNTDNKCLCQLSYGGNICENSIDLTNPLFTGTSFINYDQPIVWDNGRITFETQIVPLKDDGTIFKVVNSGQNPPNTNVTFHLYMKDGKLNYDVIHVPTGTILAHVRSHNTDLNGRKSTITIENNLVPGTNRLGSVALSVDNDRAQSRDVISVVNNTLPSYNVEIKMLPKSEIFIGAPSRESVLKTKDEMNNGKETNFQGSILSFSINGRPIKLIKDATNGLGVINNTPGTCENMCRNGAQCMTEGWRSFCQCPEGFQGAFCESRSCDHCLNGGMCIDLRGNDNYACLCPYGWTGINCDQKLDIDVKNTFKFNGMKFGYPSYVTFAPLSPSIQNDFEIKFKFIIDERESAVWKNSLLMFAGQNTAQSSRNPYIAVGLQNGYVVFRYDLANEGENEMRELVSPQPLDRSIPSHEVRFGRNRQDSWLNVDSQQAVIDKSQSNARLDIWNGLFVGGYNTFLMRLLPRGASVFRNGFKGCIYDIYIRNGPTELKTILDSGAHLTQSLNVLPCFKESLCSSASCQNNGVCMELGANYHCRCTPQYAGPTCDMINPQFSTTTISNAIQTNIGGIIIPGSQSISPATDMQTISSTSIDSFSRNQCELIIDNSLNEAFSVNIKFAGNPDTDQIIIILNIMAENKSLYKLTFVLDFRPLINIKKGETLAIKDDVFILPLNNSMTIRNFTLSKIKSKLTINVNDVIHDLQVNITNHEIIHSLSLGLGNLNQNATSESIFNANKKFCYKTAELIIQNSVINIEDYFNCNMIQKCTN
ncbi:protein eyes shut homolog isoform X1 [Gordionus sp. m RMFG-2023]|uniref:protein eyes shut homolog isoform X1 n=1 Tax=Gordionus sp. m RMFG-2023 TaxID=3053472 RepID=UPI0031FDA1ED